MTATVPGAAGATRYAGSRIGRIEDPRLLTGRGRYVDDVVLPGMLHAAFVRSPEAHAKIVSVDTSAAKSHPGVRAVYAGAEVQSAASVPEALTASRAKRIVTGATRP